MTENIPWHVVYTASRQEKKVSVLLDRYQIKHYLPLVKKLRVWSDRKKWVEMPLFNGYVFVQPKPAERDQVLQIPGVVKYLKYNGADAQVSSREIELIHRLIEKGYNLEADAAGSLRKGDKVRIEQGPLKGIEAEVLKDADGSETVWIAFETISQVVKVSISPDILVKNKTNNPQTH
jgi:transcription antitermination factor NusG